MRLFIFIAYLILVSTPAMAMQSTSAKQAYIIDHETGQVLIKKNESEAMPTSSMSKVMTMYMVFEAVKNGTIDMDTKFSVSEEAWKKGGSKMFVEQGKEIKVKDLAQGVIVQSGNDATIVLAEGLSGSEDSFAMKMTAKAKDLGMHDSNFVNASGWPDENHYSTAKDLSIMAGAMINDHPEHFKLFSQKEFSFSNIKQQNRNPLLYRNIGADGMKTGHTEAAGYGLIGTAKDESRRVIMVLNGLESEKDRANEGTRLISWALNSFTNIDFIKADTEIDQAPVTMGQNDAVAVGIKEDVKITVPKSQKENVIVDLTYKSPLIAPVMANTKIGTVTIKIPTMDPLTYPLYTLGDVEELGFFKKTTTKMKKMILGGL